MRLVAIHDTKCPFRLVSCETFLNVRKIGAKRGFGGVDAVEFSCFLGRFFENLARFYDGFGRFWDGF